nr:MAG TPA: chromosome partitioning protein [Caudoviricetes sp.]
MAGKASKKFDLGELTRALAGDVPDSGTESRDQIEYIDIGLIDSDPGNFYELRDIPDLAGDIETVGLQQPLLVRPGEDGHVVLISGHRRRAALQLLVAEGKEQFRQVPCIRKTGGNPLVYEMQLIFANCHTRVLTNAEIAKQALRIEEIFYQLKEQGYEFPGRMVGHVAKACNIKRAKLGRLKKIEAHLAPCYKPLWDAGDLPEDTADALAGLPQEVQKRIKRVCPKKTPTASNIREIGAKMKTGFCYDVIGLKCPDGGVCTQRDKFLKHNLTCYNWERCSGGKCCVECSAGGAHRVDGSACGAACAEMCAKARAVYEKAKAEKKDSEEREAAKARSKAVQKAMADAARIVRAADAAGLDDDAKLESAYSPLTKVGVLRKISQGDIPEGVSNYVLGEIIPCGTDDLISMAQALHCSTDYLLGLTDQLRPAASEPGQMVLAAWMPGGLTPTEECEVVADVDPGDGGKPVRCFLRWLGGAWMFKNLDKKIGMTVLRWLRLPEVEKEENDD